MRAEAILNRIALVTASNDEDCLNRNLRASDLVRKHNIPLHVERGAPSASIAYNRGLDATQAEFIIFTHQDVYFPPCWHEDLARAIAEVEALDPDWALIAPFGMTKDGTHIGDVWSTSQSARIGQRVEHPVAAESFDELVIILRRESGLRFDDALPLYHLYGTDIVQIAHAAGRGAYVVPMPVVHNDGFKARLGRDFTEGYHYVRRKWRAKLPIRTPMLWIRAHGLSLPLYRLRARRRYNFRKAKAGDVSTDPKVYSLQSGWE